MASPAPAIEQESKADEGVGEGHDEDHADVAEVERDAGDRRHVDRPDQRVERGGRRPPPPPRTGAPPGRKVTPSPMTRIGIRTRKRTARSTSGAAAVYCRMIEAPEGPGHDPQDVARADADEHVAEELRAEGGLEALVGEAERGRVELGRAPRARPNVRPAPAPLGRARGRADRFPATVRGSTPSPTSKVPSSPRRDRATSGRPAGGGPGPPARSAHGRARLRLGAISTMRLSKTRRRSYDLSDHALPLVPRRTRPP